MSPNIWTRCAASFRPRRLELLAYRVVESQHVLSTRKLVDSDEEQALLEELIDRVKPPVPPGPEFRGLHYLLFTPFRHPPLRYGSRFGTRAERGIWYGSKELATSFAEVAYYRLLFLEGSAATLGTLTVELTAYTAAIRTRAGADLTRLPFKEHESAISSKTSYDASQRLGRDMRAARVAGFLFVSARAPARGTNVGLFLPAFASKRPKRFETWTCSADRSKVELSSKSIARTRTARLAFAREDFVVGGKLPSPAT
jgi:RES domain-containing protein